MAIRLTRVGWPELGNVPAPGAVEGLLCEHVGWDVNELTCPRNLFHREPHVCRIGDNQYTDEMED